MRLLTEASWANKTALIRVDFNVPMDKSGNITDDRRIIASLPTIRHILAQGGALVLMSHLGRPKGERNLKYSLKPVADHLAKILNQEVLFADDCISEETESLCRNLKSGQIVLLENLRFYPQEEKGDKTFAEKLARLGNVYVNDAFATAHRAHASTTTVAQFFQEKYAGFLLQAEVENAKKVLNNAKKPFVAIMGGAKVADKMQLIENLLPKIDALIIGGGMTYTFALAKGYEIGTSIRDADHLEAVKMLLSKIECSNIRFLLPTDTFVAKKALESCPTTLVHLNNIPRDQAGVDIGTDTINQAREIILSAKTILWNGPMGVFEVPEYAKGTEAIARLIVEATQKNGAYSLIGGGDSAAAIEQLGLADQVSYVSTGGGALLEYMQGDVLPGIQALEV
jgi:phosphoglycerate kinase